jgi:hypothetical protein
LFNRDHLALHLPKFSGGLFVPADEEGGGQSFVERCLPRCTPAGD